MGVLDKNMNKKEFYKIQAEAFKDYYDKFSEVDLLSVFEGWAEGKDFVEVDEKRIWKVVKEQENGKKRKKTEN